MRIVVPLVRDFGQLRNEIETWTGLDLPFGEKHAFDPIVQADKEMEKEGGAEEERAKILEDQDITDALQIAAALKKAQREKARRIAQERRAAREESSGKEKDREPETTTSTNMPTESLLLTPAEVSQVLSELTLARFQKHGEQGMMVEFIAQPLQEEKKKSLVQKGLDILADGYEKVESLAKQSPKAAKMIKETLVHTCQALDIYGYAESAAMGGAVGAAYGSTVPGVGTAAGGVVGMIGGMYAYHQTKTVVGALFSTGTDLTVEVVKAQGQNPFESERYGTAMEGSVGFLASLGGMKGLKVKGAPAVGSTGVFTKTPAPSKSNVVALDLGKIKEPLLPSTTVDLYKRAKVC